MSRDPDRHCPTTSCACTHDTPCYRGWIDLTDDHDEDREYVVPCQTCRPAQRRITKLAYDRADMGKQLRARAQARQDWGGA